MKTLRLVLRVKNNRLVRLREEEGLSLTECARLASVPVSTLSGLECLRISPRAVPQGKYRRSQSAVDGEADPRVWTPSAQKIAAFHGMSCDWLWPDEVRELCVSAMRLEVSRADMLGPESLLEQRELAAAMQAATEVLSPGQRHAIRHITEGVTFAELARSADCLGENIRVRERTSLRILRRGRAALALRDYAGGVT